MCGIGMEHLEMPPVAAESMFGSESAEFEHSELAAREGLAYWCCSPEENMAEVVLFDSQLLHNVESNVFQPIMEY